MSESKRKVTARWAVLLLALVVNGCVTDYGTPTTTQGGSTRLDVYQHEDRTHIMNEAIQTGINASESHRQQQYFNAWQRQQQQAEAAQRAYQQQQQELQRQENIQRRNQIIEDAARENQRLADQQRQIEAQGRLYQQQHGK